MALTQNSRDALIRATARRGQRAIHALPDAAARDAALAIRAELLTQAREFARLEQYELYFRANGYSRDELSRIQSLNVLYARSSRIRALIQWNYSCECDGEHSAACKSSRNAAFIRSYRLESLNARINARIRTVGNFPVSAHALRGGQAQDTVAGIRVIVPINSARYHYSRAELKFGFTIPGVDEFDVLNVAILNAIQAGDTVTNSRGETFPTYGMFARHVKFAAMHFHREFFAELRGPESDVTECDELAASRRIGTVQTVAGTRHRRTYATRDDAIAAARANARDTERALIEEARRVEHLSRHAEFRIESEFARTIGILLLNGETVSDIAEFLGVMPRTIGARVRAELPAPIRVGFSPTDSVACPTCAEFAGCAHADAQVVADAQAAHGRRMRDRYLAIKRADEWRATASAMSAYAARKGA